MPTVKIILCFPKNNAKARLLPMSLLMLAPLLKKAGFEVVVIDERMDEDWRRNLISLLEKGDVLMVGISVLTGQAITHALKISEIVRQNSPAKVVWGGVHPSLLPEQTLANDLIDFVVIGEGESTLLELAQSLAGHGEISGINGIGYKKDGRIIINPSRPFIDLNQSERPSYELVDVERYVTKVSLGSGGTRRDIDFYTSRGCPYRCGFCYNQNFNRSRWRGQSAQKVVEHMEYLVDKFGVTLLDIEDDEFFIDKERVMDICRLLEEKKLNLEIVACHRVDLFGKVSAEELDQLRRAGFRNLVFGVESGSPRILKLIRKDIACEQVLAAVEKLKAARIGSKYCFMVGFPEETLADIYQTTDLILAMKKINPNILIPPWRIYTPYPGTDLYESSIKQGFVPPARLEDWANFDFENINMPWIGKQRRKIIANITFFFPFVGLSEIKESGLYLKLGRWYGKTVDWRWRHHWFNFVPEKTLVKLWLRLKDHSKK
ncbi:MAG: radical SAM protein [Patescibacteria group bacterium]